MPLWSANTFPAAANTAKPHWLNPTHLGLSGPGNPHKINKGQNPANTYGVSKAMTANNMGRGGNVGLSPGWVYVRVGTGPVTSVTINTLTAGGFTVNSNVSVVFSGGGGAGANGIAQFTNGNLSSIIIDNKGAGYNAAPTVTIVGGNGNTTAAQLIAVMDGRCGRVQTETLVWIKNMVGNDPGNTLPIFGS